jgi:hypothetical protein
LTAAAFAIDQLQQFIAQQVVPEQVGKTDNGLFNRPDPAHHVSALLQQLAQLFMSLPHNLLHMSIDMGVDGSSRAWLTLHKPSPALSPTLGLLGTGSLDDTHKAP